MGNGIGTAKCGGHHQFYLKGDPGIISDDVINVCRILQGGGVPVAEIPEIRKVAAGGGVVEVNRQVRTYIIGTESKAGNRIGIYIYGYLVGIGTIIGIGNG